MHLLCPSVSNLEPRYVLPLEKQWQMPCIVRSTQYNSKDLRTPKHVLGSQYVHSSLPSFSISFLLFSFQRMVLDPITLCPCMLDRPSLSGVKCDVGDTDSVGRDYQGEILLRLKGWFGSGGWNWGMVGAHTTCCLRGGTLTVKLTK